MIFEKGKAIFESIVSEYKRYIELGVYKDEEMNEFLTKVDLLEHLVELGRTFHDEEDD